MSDKEEMWREEFASLVEEDFEETNNSEKKRCPRTLLGMLCIIYIFMIGGASIVTLLTGGPVVYGDATFFMLGTLFFAGFLLLLAFLYSLEGEERITNPIYP